MNSTEFSNSNIGAAATQNVVCKKCYGKLQAIAGEYYCKTCDIWYDIQLCRIKRGKVNG